MMMYKFALARYLENGQLDKSFDYDGKLVTDIPFLGEESIESITIDSRGRILVAGWAESTAIDAEGTRFALARYNDDGSLDSSFGLGGWLMTNFDQLNDDAATAVTIDACGRIVAAGSVNTNDGEQFALARYYDDGSLDMSFGKDGKVVTNFTSTSNEYITSLAIDHARRIVVAGSAITGTSAPLNPSSSRVFALARYNEDGSLDTSFDNDGKVLTDFTSSLEEYANAMVIDGMGKIVVGGCSVVNKQTSQFALARYNEDGSLDKRFDNDGKVITEFGMHQRINALAVDRNDRIIAAGISREMLDMGEQFALARYNRDGSLDKTFGTDGKVITDFSSTSDEFINAIALDRFGRIVVAGEAFNDNARKNIFALARYNSDGSLDKSFDNDGKVLTNFSSTSDGSMISAVAVDHHGRIVVGGSSDV